MKTFKIIYLFTWCYFFFVFKIKLLLIMKNFLNGKKFAQFKEIFDLICIFCKLIFKKSFFAFSLSFNHYFFFLKIYFINWPTAAFCLMFKSRSYHDTFFQIRCHFVFLFPRRTTTFTRIFNHLQLQLQFTNYSLKVS